MAVPSSGQLRLRADIALEVDGVATGTNLSLRTLSASAGFSTPDNMSEFYGYSSVVLATSVTYSSDSVSDTSFRAVGGVTNAGGGNILDRGFYIGTNSASPTNNTKHSLGAGSLGTYTYTKSASQNTTYYVWAYATNEAGTSYGSRITTQTLVTFVPQLYNYAYYNYPHVYSAQSARGANDSNSGGYRNPITGAYVTTKTVVPLPSGQVWLDSHGFQYCINAPTFVSIHNASGWSSMACRMTGNSAIGHTNQPGTYSFFGNVVANYVSADSTSYIEAVVYPSDPPAVTNIGLVTTIN